MPDVVLFLVGVVLGAIIGGAWVYRTIAEWCAEVCVEIAKGIRGSRET